MNSGSNLYIPQMAEEFKDRTSEAPDQAYVIDYPRTAELTEWTVEEVEGYRRGRKKHFATIWR